MENGNPISKELFEAKFEILKKEDAHLRELFLAEVEALKELYVASEKSHEENLELARKNTDKEFAKTNEFRGQLDDFSKRLALKSEVDSLNVIMSAGDKATNSKIDANKDTIDNKILAVKSELEGKINLLERANSSQGGRSKITDKISDNIIYVIIAAVLLYIGYLLKT